MLLIWGGGGGKIFLSGEEAFHFFRESFNLLNRENCDLANLYKTKRREPPDSWQKLFTCLEKLWKGKDYEFEHYQYNLFFTYW